MRVRIALGFIAGFTISSAAIADVGYVSVRIGPAPGTGWFRAFDLNDQGTIVGEYILPNGSEHAASWKNGVFTDYGSFGYTDANALRVNNNDQIIGRAQLAPTPLDYHDDPFLIDHAVPQILPRIGTTAGRPGGAYTYGINDAGDAVGTSASGQFVTVNGSTYILYHAALWSQGAVTDLGVPAGMNQSTAFAINASGQVIGTAQDASGTVRAGFLWSSDSGIAILTNSLGSGDVIPLAINDSGSVVGTYRSLPVNDPNSQTKPFVYDGTQMLDLPLPADAFANSASPTDINNNGQIVGKCASPRGDILLLWDHGQLYELNEFLPADAGPFGWFSATRINNLGQISLEGQLLDGTTRSFFLTPVPVPGSLVLFVAGVTCLVVQRRRGGNPRRSVIH